MIIDIREFLLHKIGHTDWYGESNYDRKSLENLDTLNEILNYIEDFREELLLKLEEHINYRKGNGSANALHAKAKEMRKNHIIKEFVDLDFDDYWEN